MWEYLDKMDKNLLYDYAQLFSSRKKNLCFFGRSDEELTEQEVHQREVEAKDKTFYLIWFVYRYVLGCETLEEALQYDAKEVLDTYKLKALIGVSSSQNTLYVGIDKECMLRKYEDMPIVLEILYKRLNFWEQLDCFIENINTGKITSQRYKRCIEARERYRELLGKK